MQHAILLVESDGVLRDAIAFQLRDDGYFVVALSDGTSALAVAQHNPLSLVYLVCHRRMVLTRDRLLISVWCYDRVIDSRTVDVHVRWLRQKIEDDPDTPQLILTVRGVGYRFKE